MNVASRQAHSHLCSILDTAVEGIVVIDESGIVQTFNRAAQSMFGYDAGEVIGRNVGVLMPEPYRGEHDGYMKRYRQTGVARVIGIGRDAFGRKKDGTVFPIELAVSEVRDGGKRTFTGIVRDVSERQQLEKEILDASEREQRRIGRELHDGLCQELAGIMFLTQSLEQKLAKQGTVEPSEAAQVTELVREAVKHARALSQGLHPVDAQPAGLAVALEWLAESAAEIFKISCTFRCRPGVTVNDPAIATNLYRIAQEAVRDAIHRGMARRVKIELARRHEMVDLEISDDGINAAPDGRVRDDMALRMMMHRARVIGATLGVFRRAQGGLRVSCEVVDSLPREATQHGNDNKDQRREGQRQGRADRFKEAKNLSGR